MNKTRFTFEKQVVGETMKKIITLRNIGALGTGFSFTEFITGELIFMKEINCKLFIYHFSFRHNMELTFAILKHFAGISSLNTRDFDFWD